MKHLSESVTFTENPFSLLWVVVPVGIVILIICLAGFSIIASTNTHPEPKIGFNEFFGVVMGIEILLFLLFFFVFSFQRKRIVTCDSESCDISSSNFWNTFYETDNFRWSAATDTNIIEEFVDKGAKAIFLEVEVNHYQKRVMAFYPFHQKPFVELVKFVNQATPQLNYVWEKTSDFGERQVIVEVRSFIKVARI